MPVRPGGENVHDLPPVGLHVVEILDRHVEERATERVVDARNEGFLVLAFLETRHHVRLVGDDGRHKARNILRFELEVGGIEDQDVALRDQVAAAKCVGNSAASAMPNGAQEWIARLELLQDLPGVVGRSVVDDNDFVADRAAPKRGVRLLHEEGKVLRFIVGGYQHRHTNRRRVGDLRSSPGLQGALDG